MEKAVMFTKALADFFAPWRCCANMQREPAKFFKSA